MPGLIASPDNGSDPTAMVVADGWFPPIRLAAIRDTVRLGEGVVTDARLIAAIEGAMISAFRALKEWRAERILAGAVEFEQVSALTIGGRSQAEILWERIIRHYAAAELGDMHRDISATNDGDDRADAQERTADDHRRLAYAAVADLKSLGLVEAVPRNRVSLL